jgi:hypothetical protein
MLEKSLWLNVEKRSPIKDATIVKTPITKILGLPSVCFSSLRLWTTTIIMPETNAKKARSHPRIGIQERKIDTIPKIKEASARVFSWTMNYTSLWREITEQ